MDYLLNYRIEKWKIISTNRLLVCWEVRCYIFSKTRTWKLKLKIFQNTRKYIALPWLKIEKFFIFFIFGELHENTIFLRLKHLHIFSLFCLICFLLTSYTNAGINYFINVHILLLTTPIKTFKLDFCPFVLLLKQPVLKNTGLNI